MGVPSEASPRLHPLPLLQERAPQPHRSPELQLIPMALSNMNKEVTTRLFQMLAVNEQNVRNVKRDHASYAKLSLLTQQMSLLQKQAQLVVDKSQAHRVGEDVQLHETCTALNECDEGARQLLSLLAVNEKTKAKVKRDSAACAMLSLLAGQVGLLQEQAQQAVDESEINFRLAEIGTKCKLVPGTVYFHYMQHGKDVLSLIAEDEWSNYDEFLGKYLYDYDFTFRKMHGNEHHRDCVLPQPKLLLPSSQPLLADPAITPLRQIEGGHVVEPAWTHLPYVNEGPVPICGVLSRW